MEINCNTLRKLFADFCNLSLTALDIESLKPCCCCSMKSISLNPRTRTIEIWLPPEHGPKILQRYTRIIRNNLNFLRTYTYLSAKINLVTCNLYELYTSCSYSLKIIANPQSTYNLHHVPEKYCS